MTASRARALIAALAALASADSPWPAKPWPLYIARDAARRGVVFILRLNLGSSTLVENFNQHTACEISGVFHAGEFMDLARFVEDFERADSQYRGDSHSELRVAQAVLNRESVVRAQEGLVRALLNRATRRAGASRRSGTAATRLDTFAHESRVPVVAMCEDCTSR